MPSVSTKQKKAMRAACAGKSNIGIPKSVGCEYVAADKRQAKQKVRRKQATTARARSR